jgi:alpha-galactosidase
LRYPPIAAAAATAVTPEQAAIWAYPQPDHTLDEIALTLTGALLGRVHLSGFFNLMSPEQSGLVRSAISVYKDLRPELGGARPFWPVGLPGWEDEWIAHGLRGRGATFLSVCRRPPENAGAATPSSTLAIPHLRGRHVRPVVLYPPAADAAAEWNADAGRLTVSLPRGNPAVLLRLDPVAADA